MRANVPDTQRATGDIDEDQEVALRAELEGRTGNTDSEGEGGGDENEQDQ